MLWHTTHHRIVRDLNPPPPLFCPHENMQVGALGEDEDEEKEAVDAALLGIYYIHGGDVGWPGGGWVRDVLIPFLEISILFGIPAVESKKILSQKQLLVVIP